MDAMLLADRAWSALVRHYAMHRCFVCGKMADDAHHWWFIRSIKKYRWNIKNGVALCRICHQKIELDPRPLYDAIKERDPEKWEWAMQVPPLRQEPIANEAIWFLAKSLQRTARKEGITLDLKLKLAHAAGDKRGRYPGKARS